MLMLFHHTFYTKGDFTDITVNGMQVINATAWQCKVCVAIFVFLSGYGLTVKYNYTKHIPLQGFYRRRFVKLMLNYWLVWVVFVPLSLLWLSDKPFGWGYGTTHLKIKGVLDFLGIMQWFGGAGPYNPNWWFYSCIMGMYILFPFLKWILDRSAVFTVGLAIALYYIPGPLFGVVRQFLLVFVVGMIYAKYSATESEMPRLPLWGWVILLAMLFLFRYTMMWAVVYLYDAILVCVGVAVYQNSHIRQRVRRVLSFFGRYSMDMFLTHFFLLSLWPSTKSIVYATRNPLIIYLTIVAMSLLLAVVLGEVKERSGFNRLVERLRK